MRRKYQWINILPIVTWWINNCTVHHTHTHTLRVDDYNTSICPKGCFINVNSITVVEFTPIKMKSSFSSSVLYWQYYNNGPVNALEPTIQKHALNYLWTRHVVPHCNSSLAQNEFVSMWGVTWEWILIVMESTSNAAIIGNLLFPETGVCYNLGYLLKTHR